VSLMHGEIGVLSTPGQGSTFWFEVRLPQQLGVARLLELDLGLLAHRKILVLDPSSAVREGLAAILASWRMECSTAAYAGELAPFVKNGKQLPGPTEFMLLSVGLPESEYQLLDQLLPPEPQRSRFRCLGMGARQTGELSGPAQAWRWSALLPKPVRHAALARALLTALSGTNHHPVATTPAGSLKSLAPQPQSAISAVVHPIRILLAEDNPVNQKVALRQLQKLGYAADAVGDGLQVLAAMRKQQYDVVLMDCQMPELDGFETTHRIRHDPEFQVQPRIIAITANAMEGDREKCLSRGMDDYISKPVRIDELKAVLERNHLRAVPSHAAG